MTKQDVMNALSFWTPGAWPTDSQHPPTTLGDSGIAKIVAAISELYDRSPTVKAYLESLAAEGPIRIGGGSPGQVVFPDAGPAYIRIDPNIQLLAVSNFGEFFSMQFEVILGHEISHLFDHVHNVDPTSPTNNAGMNVSNYDFTGENVRIEWQITNELMSSEGWPETQLRASYGGSALAGSTRLDDISLLDSFADEYVEIVRFGNIEPNPSTGLAIIDDVIDYSQRTDGRSTLTFGFSGNDHVIGSNVNDWVYGGKGIDTVSSGDGNDHLFGEDGDDDLHGGSGNDDIFGGIDADHIYGDADDDKLFGGDGEDVIVGGGGKDYIDGGAGADIIDGGSDYDYVDYSHSNHAVILEKFDSTTLLGSGTPEGDVAGDWLMNIEKIFGSVFDDHIEFADSGMSVDGGEGDDVLTGGTGNDVLIGGVGWDTLNGGEGNDIIIDDSAVEAAGGDGHDYIDVISSLVTGGDGSDYIILNGAAVADGGAGNDHFHADSSVAAYGYDLISQNLLGHDFVSQDGSPDFGAGFVSLAGSMENWEVSFYISDTSVGVEYTESDDHWITNHYWAPGTIVFRKSDSSSSLAIGGVLADIQVDVGVSLEALSMSQLLSISFGEYTFGESASNVFWSQDGDPNFNCYLQTVTSGELPEYYVESIDDWMSLSLVDPFNFV